MKKIILMLSFVGFCVFSYSQDKTEPQSQISETERIIDKYLDKTGDAINKLAESLKVPAERVYGILVKQQVVSSWTWFVIDTVLLFIAVMLWAFWFKYDEDHDEWWGLPVLATVVFLGFFAGSISTIVSGFVNPEYGAIKDILEVIKG